MNKNILDNLNHKFKIIDGEPCCGGKEIIEKVLKTCPIQLPGDYIEFLEVISGQTNDGKESLGLEFEVEVQDDTLSLFILSAQQALEKYEEYKIFSSPIYDYIIDQIWIIGDDLGDLLYFYGEGKEGFGIYVAEDGALSFENADKVADNLTDFLVKGIGIDIAFWSEP